MKDVSKVAFVLLVAWLVSFVAYDHYREARAAADRRPEIQSLTDRVEKLEHDLADVRFDVSLAKLSEDQQERALFDPQQTRGYAAIRAPAGPVLVALDRVDPYLDGFTVSMRIGNPSAATYSGVKAKVRWGRLYDQRKNSEWNALKEREIELPDMILAGTWTVVKFNVAPATAEEVRRIVFEPSFDQLRLR